MDTQLTANVRATSRGKTDSRKVRAAGQLPAVVYSGGSEARSISVDPRALVDMFRKSQNRNTVVELTLDGTLVPCLVREVQRHPLSREILHVDFQALDAKKPVNVEVPLVATGKAKGLASGGRVEVLRRSLKVSCAFNKIPTSLEFDASDLDVGDIARVSQVKAPEGVEVVFEADYPIVTVSGKIKDKAEAAAAPAPAKKK
jgi:large subunit ribosomal protein L25